MQVDLKEPAGGALQEKFDSAIAKVVENMQDPNTPYKNKRSITIKIAFTQNEERNSAGAETSVEVKLAPASPILTNFAIGKDLRDGTLYAEEYGPVIRGQMTVKDLSEEEEKDNKVVPITKEA